jgi:negative regulator of sigma E activity
MPPEAAASFKQMGLDKMISIVRPDKKLTLVIYPSLRSYSEVPMSKEDAADLDRKYTVQSKKLGNENIAGHACEKIKMTVTADNGQKHEATVWNAIDLSSFPVQIQMDQPDATVVMQFNNVQLVKPDAKQFDAPAGFTKHASVEKIMQDAMMKGLGK